MQISGPDMPHAAAFIRGSHVNGQCGKVPHDWEQVLLVDLYSPAHIIVGHRQGRQRQMEAHGGPQSMPCSPPF
jgi:hypothetical protein